jgi:heptosyltransferase-3
VNRFQKFIMARLPGPLHSGLKSLKKWFIDHVADSFYFPVWLAFQCLCHRKRAVILCRTMALGDVVCTLPLGTEIRKRHPAQLFVFVTALAYERLVLLSRVSDRVYGSRSWKFSPSTCFGLVEKIYAAQVTGDHTNDGIKCHLVDDLAQSCGMTLTNRQPRLFPGPELLKKTQTAYGLTKAIEQNHWIIGINCGRTWPVRMWDATKWQCLVNRLHAEYCNLTILQFGLTKGSVEADEFDQIRGVISVVNRLQSDELVALVASCRLLVSIDSGPVHIAGAVGTPVVGLFGAVNPLYRLPPNSPSIGLFSDVPCRFCQHLAQVGHWKDGCPHDIQCMKELDVQPVFEAVKTMIV